jgi:hypothetical protein
VDVFSIAKKSTTSEAFRALQEAWDAMRGSNRTATLQLAYITNNPHPLGSKDALDRAPGPLTYNAVHELFHGTFRELVRTQGYYDLFLINLDGDCIYTVFKELDFGTNLLNGKWASSGLAKAFRAALDSARSGRNAVHMVDFEPYAPSQGALASFVCTGVRDSAGGQSAVLCIQRPSDVVDCAISPQTRAAMSDLNAAWSSLGTEASMNAAQALQLAYITNNPNPVGSKDALDRAPAPLTYHAVHEQYHKFFRTFIKLKGYYDLFLINLDGDCIYTVFKELDFGTNLLNGKWASSGLAKVFRAARAAPDLVHKVDFEPYAPSQGALASFVCTGVRDSAGVLLGMLVFQVPFDFTVQVDEHGELLESCVTFEHSSASCECARILIVV